MNFFSTRFADVTSRNCQVVRDYLARLPCDGIERITDGYLAAQLLDGLRVRHIEFDPDPSSKDLERDGQIAVYTHHISNGSLLEYRPDGFRVLPALFFGEVRKDLITIRFTDQPGQGGNKAFHKHIVDILQSNIALLNREIDSYDAALSATSKAAMLQRTEFCKALERRKQDL